VSGRAVYRPSTRSNPAIAGLVRSEHQSLGVFALAKGAVGDLAQQARIVVHGANVAPVDNIRICFKMVIAQGRQPLRHRVDLELGGHEGIEGIEGMVGGLTARWVVIA
jgi:hypothetical protein